ncbi:hypothetical protein T492DRAFT_1061685 [Pavlovales sp. CCMP2436]|nr:hypothetical protein T492DRAFT_1061685 [Pavlovales sp. CCMP2436]|mmetsp:Transcript_44508/g.110283  ORF Transcript_44508/g.110283 Transcript_44508/m.110283 type:complete len:249 (+) Transcript_44508:146-892(+)
MALPLALTLAVLLAAVRSPTPTARRPPHAGREMGCLLNLAKSGRGRDASWLLGSYHGGLDDEGSDELEFEIRLRLDASPTEPCYILSCVPTDATKPRGPQSLGHVLLAGGDGSSTLRGMCVREDQRGKGYSRLLLGIWLRMCHEAGVETKTKPMNKPLISLTLNHFGFIPRTAGWAQPMSRQGSVESGADVLPAPSRRAVLGTDFLAPTDSAALDVLVHAAVGGGLRLAASPADLARALTLRALPDVN